MNESILLQSEARAKRARKSARWAGLLFLVVMVGDATYRLWARSVDSSSVGWEALLPVLGIALALAFLVLGPRLAARERVRRYDVLDEATKVVFNTRVISRLRTASALVRLGAVLILSLDVLTLLLLRSPG